MSGTVDLWEGGMEIVVSVLEVELKETKQSLVLCKMSIGGERLDRLVAYSLSTGSLPNRQNVFVYLPLVPWTYLESTSNTHNNYCFSKISLDFLTRVRSTGEITCFKDDRQMCCC